MKMKSTITVLFLFTLLFGIQLNLYAQVPEQELQSLVALYDSTDGDNWTDNTNWLSEQPVSSWYGITVVDDHVAEIDLQNNNLNGMIPSGTGVLIIDARK